MKTCELTLTFKTGRRQFVGSFKTEDEANREGKKLLARGLNIKSFDCKSFDCENENKKGSK